MTGELTLPSSEVLTGPVVQLEPLTEAHLPKLMAIAFAHPEAFALTSTPRNDAEAADYFGTVLNQRAAGTAHPVAIVLRESGQVVGTSRLTEMNMHDRNCHLGYTWLDPATFGKGVNLDSKILLLRFAFDGLKLHRVQIRTDSRNLRSQHAIEALGAQREGVLRRHMLAADGYLRDTVIYSITDLEWPDVRERLLAKQRAYLSPA